MDDESSESLSQESVKKDMKFVDRPFVNSHVEMLQKRLTSIEQMIKLKTFKRKTTKSAKII